jgi:hypothetical protein
MSSAFLQNSIAGGMSAVTWVWSRTQKPRLALFPKANDYQLVGELHCEVLVKC